MELPNGTENLLERGGLAGFVGLAVAWAIFYYRRLRNQPAIDPVTQKFLDGLRVDFDELKNSVMAELGSMKGTNRDVVNHIEAQLEGFRIELGQKTVQIAVLENELTHIKRNGK